MKFPSEVYGKIAVPFSLRAKDGPTLTFSFLLPSFAFYCQEEECEYWIKQYPCPKGRPPCLFIVARSLEVCDSRGFQFVAKLARICHSCSHPLALATRQNLKKSHHLRQQKIAGIAAALVILDISHVSFTYNVGG